jgi:hypothetical protein
MEIQQIRLALCEDVNFARPNATVSRNRSHAVNWLEIELGGLQQWFCDVSVIKWLSNGQRCGV